MTPRSRSQAETEINAAPRLQPTFFTPTPDRFPGTERTPSRGLKLAQICQHLTARR